MIVKNKKKNKKMQLIRFFCSYDFPEQYLFIFLTSSIFNFAPLKFNFAKTMLF